MVGDPARRSCEQLKKDQRLGSLSANPAGSNPLKLRRVTSKLFGPTERGVAGRTTNLVLASERGVNLDPRSTWLASPAGYR
jgi:hypothetical protein